MLGFCFEAPVSAPSAGMGEPEPLQPQQWNGVVEAECLEPQEPQQWTGVVDAARMPGKFGGPNTFAHLTGADWRSRGWWQDGPAYAADGSWPCDGEEEADDQTWGEWSRRTW